MALDVGLVILFLAVTAYFAYRTRKTVVSFKDFALGGRNFSTSVLINTLIATLLSSEVIVWYSGISYSYGFFWCLLLLMIVSCGFLVVAFVIAPRSRRVLGHLSIAESMGSFYGPSVRVISALGALLLCLSGIAFQIKFTSELFGDIFGLQNPMILTILLTCFIVGYSTIGGIKAVTITDVVQCVTFCILLPLLTVYVFGIFYIPNNTVGIFEAANYTTKGSSFLNIISFMLLACMPELEPAGYQRLLMARDERQARDVFIAGGIIAFATALLIGLMGRFVWISNQSLEMDDLIPFIVRSISYTGIKGLFMVCILAMIMSTADSYFNTASILVIHDIIPFFFSSSWKSWLKTHSLKAVRIANIILGLFSMIFSIGTTRLLSLFEVSFTYYETLVVIPLLIFFIGFRPSPRATLVAITASFLFITYWVVYLPIVFPMISELPGNQLIIMGPAIIFLIIVMSLVNYLSPGPKLAKQSPKKKS